MTRPVALGARGRTFTRSVIAMALARGAPDVAARIASDRWGPTSSAAFVTRSAVEAGTTGTWAEQIVSLEGATSEFIALVAERTVQGRLAGRRRVPANTRLLQPTSGAGAAWVGEGQAVPVSPIVFAAATLKPKKVASLIVLSQEVLEATSSEAAIRNDMVDGLASEIDLALLDPANAGSDEMPAAITNGVTPIAGTGDWDADLKSLFAGFGGDLTRSYAVMNPVLAAELSGAARPELGVRGGQILGLPCFTSRHAPAGKVILIDPGRLMTTEGSVEVKVSTQGSIELESAPTNDSAAPTGATLVSLWQSNAGGLAVMQRIAWAAAPGAVAVLEAA